MGENKFKKNIKVKKICYSRSVNEFMIDAHKKYRKCKILKGEYKQRKFSGPDSLSKKYKYL